MSVTLTQSPQVRGLQPRSAHPSAVRGAQDKTFPSSSRADEHLVLVQVAPDWRGRHWGWRPAALALARGPRHHHSPSPGPAPPPTHSRVLRNLEQKAPLSGRQPLAPLARTGHSCSFYRPSAADWRGQGGQAEPNTPWPVPPRGPDQQWGEAGLTIPQGTGMASLRVPCRARTWDDPSLLCLRGPVQ